MLGRFGFTGRAHRLELERILPLKFCATANGALSPFDDGHRLGPPQRKIDAGALSSLPGSLTDNARGIKDQMVARYTSSKLDAQLRVAREPMNAWPRTFVLVVAVPIVLAAAAFATNRLVGPTAAIALTAVGSGLALAAGLFLTTRRLAEADERFRVVEQALETVPQALFVLDSMQPGATNRYVNPAYTAMTGYTAAEAQSAGFDALSIFAEAAQMTGSERKLGGRTRDVTLRRRDGTLAEAKLELRTAVRRDGSRYWIGLLEAPEKSDPLADARPPPPPAPLRSPSDAFLASLSHDLRSPLNACVMWLDVLALAPQPEKITQAVDAIRRNLARQTRLVNDLSDAAKISSGRLEVRLEPLDCVALLKQHIDAWQLLAIGRQLTLQHRIEPVTAQIDADPARLSQVLNHLMENAVASTPAGGHVGLRVRCADGRCVIEIEDTGTGLSADDAANLGTPLWRSPGTLKARLGLGLGLAVAHHLARQQGGTLTATSSGATGALFTLVLPLAASERRDADTHSATARSSKL